MSKWIKFHGKCLFWIFIILAILTIYVSIRLHNARIFHIEIHRRVETLEGRLK